MSYDCNPVCNRFTDAYTAAMPLLLSALPIGSISLTFTRIADICTEHHFESIAKGPAALHRIYPLERRKRDRTSWRNGFFEWLTEHAIDPEFHQDKASCVIPRVGGSPPKLKICAEPPRPKKSKSRKGFGTPHLVPELALSPDEMLAYFHEVLPDLPQTATITQVATFLAHQYRDSFPGLPLTIQPVTTAFREFLLQHAETGVAGQTYRFIRSTSGYRFHRF